MTTVVHHHSTSSEVKRLDPMPPGKLAMWLFLASEVMFFVGLLGSYIVLAAVSPELFRAHKGELNKLLAGVNTLVLLSSSATMYLAVKFAKQNKRGKTILLLFITMLLGSGFLAIKSEEYASKFAHHTIVAIDAGQVWVYDGHAIEYSGNAISSIDGYRAKVPADFNIHHATPAQIRALSAADQGIADANQLASKTYAILGTLSQDLAYGPSKNLFFASYFVLTGVHAAHIIGGIVALIFLTAQATRGRLLAAHIEYVGLYWYFIDAVWLILFGLLYF